MSGADEIAKKATTLVTCEAKYHNLPRSFPPRWKMAKDHGQLGASTRLAYALRPSENRILRRYSVNEQH